LPNETVGTRKRAADPATVVAAEASAKPTLAELQQAERAARASERAAQAKAERAAAVARADEARVVRAQRRFDALGQWPELADWIETQEPLDEEGPPEFLARMRALWDAKGLERPFKAAEEALLAAETEAAASRAAEYDACQAVRTAGWAVREAGLAVRVQQAEAEFAAAADADDAECARFSAEDQREGLATTRAEVAPLHVDLDENPVGDAPLTVCDAMAGGLVDWWTDRLWLSGVDAPWVEREEEADIWDEETAARAEEEMRLASAARLESF